MTGIWQFVLYALLIVGSLLTGCYFLLAVIRGFQSQILEMRFRRQVVLKNYPSALAILQKTFRLNPSHVEIYFQRARIYAELGEFEAAEADFTTGLKFVRNAPAYAGRAAVRSALGRTGEALVDANHVIACSRLWWRGYYERGRVYQALGYWQIALEDFDQALSLHRPTRPSQPETRTKILAARTETAELLARYTDTRAG